MKNPIILFTIITFFLTFLLFPLQSQADNFKVKGYDIRIYGKVKQKKLHIWGDIKNGRHCSNIEIGIRFHNTDSGHSISFGSMTKEHYNRSRTLFKMTSRKYSKIKKRSWRVSRISLNCNN